MHSSGAGGDDTYLDRCQGVIKAAIGGPRAMEEGRDEMGGADGCIQEGLKSFRPTSTGARVLSKRPLEARERWRKGEV